jgi:transcriptional regulator with XRE-family HTH domain
LRIKLRACKPSRSAPGLPLARLPNPPRTLGEHLLVARYDRGLRQKDVARELGVDQFTLGNWEKGRTSPLIRFRPAIYEWLGYCPVQPAPTAIGDRLVAWRKALGLSQHEVAQRLGLDPGTLSRTEQGKVGSPNRRVRRAIEALLKMSAVSSRT